MSPNNGKLVIFDEMTSELTGYDVDQRIEYWKVELALHQTIPLCFLID